MFGNFFKRSVKPSPIAAAEHQQQMDQAASSVLAKQQALAQADAHASDEIAAAEFILQCGVADARLKAAQHVHSGPQLLRVVQAMRNVDRRVAKLMQQRLDSISRQEADAQKAWQCVQMAQGLATQTNILPNQIVELDRAWQAIGEVAADICSRFEENRSQVQLRLDAQTTLQRHVLDAKTRIQKLMNELRDPSVSAEKQQLEQALEDVAQDVAHYASAPEAASLPHNLVKELDGKICSARQMLSAYEQRRSTMQTYMDALAAWEVAPPESLQADVLKRTWRSLPLLHADDDVSLMQRFDELIKRVERTTKPAVVAGKPSQAGLQAFSSALEGMEQALNEGALQQAIEHDKTLRAIDIKALRLAPEHTVRMSAVRNELSRLQSWARWGGNISREELLKAAEELPANSQPVAELAKKVGSLRARWKWMDQSAGAASKDLWLRFDAACTAAYAPVAEHYMQMANERRQNLEKAHALIVEASEVIALFKAADYASSGIDWKALAAKRSRLSDAWRQLGPISRAEKKMVDAEFAILMRRISEPLAARQQAEMEIRGELIAQVRALNPADRTAVEVMRGIQQRWQEHAKSFPLERREEQTVWQQFRNACDEFFVQRKEITHASDTGRLQHLQEKEALCSTLESAVDQPVEFLQKILEQTKQAWSKVGHVPRESEQALKARYDAALQVVQSKLDAARHSSSAQQFEALHEKLALCYALEIMLVHRGDESAGNYERLQQLWGKLPETLPEFERVLRSRLDGVVAAIKSEDRHYASLLEQNRAFFLQDLLSLEIMAEIESPPELARERLKLQVSMLQSTLKAKQIKLKPRELLLQLCEVPALTDEQNQKRVSRLIDRFCKQDVFSAE